MTFRRLLPLASLLMIQGAGAFPPSPSTPQEQAEFLAGIPLLKGSILYRLQQSPEYLQHQKDLQDQWAFCRRIRYDAMQAWGREHLSREPATRGVLRYLFGGPDFLNAYAFFPDARVMVLGGLEPVGDVPPPEALSPAALGAALKALSDALHTFLFCGYFITSEMRPQLEKGSFQGVLPVLYTGLALTGNTVLSVQKVRPFGSPGVQIIYRHPGGPEQTLYYFKADLSDGMECRNFLGWLGELGSGASYLKAASYLLPLDSFSETRSFLLKTSDLILQDDSGIPFRNFLPGKWFIQLYGIYTDPLSIFHIQREPGLVAAYHSDDYAGPLPFGAGYHVNADDANLLLAIRNNGQPYVPPAPYIPIVIAATPAATPRPTSVRIRKALPVPIRRAIPVRTPRHRKNHPSLPVTPPAPPVDVVVPLPVVIPQPSGTSLESIPSATPVPVFRAEPVLPPNLPRTNAGGSGVPGSQSETIPYPSPSPYFLPMTSNGMPVD